MSINLVGFRRPLMFKGYDLFTASIVPRMIPTSRCGKADLVVALPIGQVRNQHQQVRRARKDCDERMEVNIHVTF